MPILEKHYTLQQAVEQFFPDGPITVATLRGAIKRGTLQATMPEGKLLVTETWLAEWFERCRVAAKLPDCGSGQPNAVAPADGSSLTERNNAALAAAKLILTERNKPSPDTSPGNTKPPRD